MIKPPQEEDEDSVNLGPTLPREIAPSVHWLGGCLPLARDGQKTSHAHNSAFLVKGRESCLLVDTGNPREWEGVTRQLAILLGDQAIDFIFPTHPEMPHAGNLDRLLDRYPDSVVCGDLRDYHLYHPAYVDHFQTFRPGDELDLGELTFVFVEAIIRDLPNTLWGYVAQSQVLFVADGLGYLHEHDAGQCAMTSEELPALPEKDQTKEINERALYWCKYVPVEPLFDQLDTLITDRYPTRVLAPAHGSVITDPNRIVPIIKEGMIESHRTGEASWDQQSTPGMREGKQVDEVKWV